MGWFGTKNSRVFSIRDSELHKPKSFGFYSVKTAHELATAMTGELLNDENCKKKLFAFIKRRPSVLQLQLVALFVAVHDLHAVCILEVPQDVRSEMREGIADGINALMSGKATEDFAYMMNASISYYAKAISTEIASSPKDPAIVTSEVDSPSTTFLQLIAKSYDTNEFNEILQAPDSFLEVMLLNHAVADAWVNLMTGLQKNALVKFIP